MWNDFDSNRKKKSHIELCASKNKRTTSNFNQTLSKETLPNTFTSLSIDCINIDMAKKKLSFSYTLKS